MDTVDYIDMEQISTLPYITWKL